MYRLGTYLGFRQIDNLIGELRRVGKVMMAWFMTWAVRCMVKLFIRLENI